MLNFRDRHYIKKLIKQQKIMKNSFSYVSKRDISNFTNEDIKKIRILEKSVSHDYIMYNEEYRNISIEQIMKLISFRFDSYYILKLLKNKYDIDSFILKILHKYIDSENNIIKKIKKYESLKGMLDRNYTINQIIFLFENDMIYLSQYHKLFDYYTLYEFCLKNKLNVKEENYNNFSIYFLRLLLSKFNKKEMKNILDLKFDDISYQMFENEVIFLIDKEFSYCEIKLLLAREIPYQTIKNFFRNGGTKDDLLEKLFFD